MFAESLQVAACCTVSMPCASTATAKRVENLLEIWRCGLCANNAPSHFVRINVSAPTHPPWSRGASVASMPAVQDTALQARWAGWALLAGDDQQLAHHILCVSTSTSCPLRALLLLAILNHASACMYAVPACSSAALRCSLCSLCLHPHIPSICVSLCSFRGLHSSQCEKRSPRWPIS